MVLQWTGLAMLSTTQRPFSQIHILLDLLCHVHSFAIPWATSQMEHQWMLQATPWTILRLCNQTCTPLVLHCQSLCTTQMWATWWMVPIWQKLETSLCREEQHLFRQCQLHRLLHQHLLLLQYLLLLQQLQHQVTCFMASNSSMRFRRMHMLTWNSSMMWVSWHHGTRILVLLVMLVTASHGPNVLGTAAWYTDGLGPVYWKDSNALNKNSKATCQMVLQWTGLAMLSTTQRPFSQIHILLDLLCHVHSFAIPWATSQMEHQWMLQATPWTIRRLCNQTCTPLVLHCQSLCTTQMWATWWMVPIWQKLETSLSRLIVPIFFGAFCTINYIMVWGRWFGIRMGVPWPNNSFHKVIPGIQSTGPQKPPSYHLLIQLFWTHWQQQKPPKSWVFEQHKV